MAEVAGESTYVSSHKIRTALFLSAMRHFAEELRNEGYRLEYRKLDAQDNDGQLEPELRKAIARFRPERIVVAEPGEYRVEQMLKAVANDTGVPLEIRPDRTFFCTRPEFAAWAKKQNPLRMEFFYRAIRRRTGILMDRQQPEGGKWNYDTDNRKRFGKQGPPLMLVMPHRFPPDAITREVIDLVKRTFPHHPGSLDFFDFPVTRQEAQTALQDFIEHRLPAFGDYQDAMWAEEPYLFHSRLSAMMNLKLLDPHIVLIAVQDAYHRGQAPLEAVEGYTRQVLGWREFNRGVYWLYMPKLLEANALNAQEELPDLYWTGETDMNCLKQSVGQTLKYGYAHHIQRLMVTGMFALLFGVQPKQVHRWYLAIYWDAVEWVELPNVLSISQYADGGLTASKPYVATGKYINRMSNYCAGCRYQPEKMLGENACPFTTLYWDFLIRHEALLRTNERMRLQMRNVQPMSLEQRESIQEEAQKFRDSLPKGSYQKRLA